MNQPNNKPNIPQQPLTGWQKFLKVLPFIIAAVVIGLLIYYLFFSNPYKSIGAQSIFDILNNPANKIKSWKASNDGAVTQLFLDYIDKDGHEHLVCATFGSHTSIFYSIFGSVGNPEHAPLGIGGKWVDKGAFSLNGNSIWVTLLINFLPMLIIFVIFFLMFRSLSKKGGMMDFGLGKNKAQIVNSNITFNDVAGYKEEKKELEEIVAFLKDPSKFNSMGVRLPRGIMLVGPSGTGKTLLAKAVSGEAHVPFMLISGSDFVEMFVGLGASRVRDMFKSARKVAPCIIFIDEIDTVGRHRGVGMGGGNDEREQTLNQLLVEMDGFEDNKGVIIIAATNRLDVIDKALLRPGRFDRQVLINLPNLEERIQIFKVHLRNKNYSQKVNIEDLARRTAGFSGAQIENMINEAAILTVRLNKTTIGLEEFDEGFDRAIAGLAKITKVYNKKEKELIAYHESGHALISFLEPDGDKVQKVTIIPRGQAGGYTLTTPLEDRILSSKNELLRRIKITLGGRAAEEIVYGKDKITTGASNDLTVCTNIAKKMVVRLGMSELGLVDYEVYNENPYSELPINNGPSMISDKKTLEINTLIQTILEKEYIQAKAILNKNRKILDLMAQALVKYETILDTDIEYIIKNKKIPDKKDSELIHKNLIDKLDLNLNNRKIKTSLKSKTKTKDLKEDSKVTKEKTPTVNDLEN